MLQNPNQAHQCATGAKTGITFNNNAALSTIKAGRTEESERINSKRRDPSLGRRRTACDEVFAHSGQGCNIRLANLGQVVVESGKGDLVSATDVEDVERELAKAGQLREYTKEEMDITLEELIGEIKETSRKMDANLNRRAEKVEDILKSQALATVSLGRFAIASLILATRDVAVLWWLYLLLIHKFSNRLGLQSRLLDGQNSFSQNSGRFSRHQSWVACLLWPRLAETGSGAHQPPRPARASQSPLGLLGI
jgi:hypothetical protein